MLSTARRFLNREQAAQFLNVKPQTLAVWASQNRHGLPFVRIGKCVRYELSDLEKWVDSRKVNSPQTQI